MVLQAEKSRNKGVTLIFITGCYISKASQAPGRLFGDDGLFGEIHPASHALMLQEML